eukprot:scaffold346397_cov36-Prasinocladus_malaysianus.AAC.1
MQEVGAGKPMSGTLLLHGGKIQLMFVRVLVHRSWTNAGTRTSKGDEYGHPCWLDLLRDLAGRFSASPRLPIVT